MGLIVAYGVAQVGSLFSADAWNNIGFTAAEVKNPKRDVALSMAFGTGIVITLYCLANLAYLFVLPLVQIQTAPDDRVATAALNAVFGAPGAVIMAVAIIISTFGCNNGLILAGARVSYAMARDGLFFRSTGRLSKRGVPQSALMYQGIWIIVLILLRTRRVDASGAVTYGNLYSDLLNYVVFAVLLFYVLTIVGIFVLRRKRPDAVRPYKAFGYPLVPFFYIVAATAIMIVLLLVSDPNGWRRPRLYRTARTRRCTGSGRDGQGRPRSRRNEFGNFLVGAQRAAPLQCARPIWQSIGGRGSRAAARQRRSCMGNPLFATKSMTTLMKEAGETGEHSLKRALGPVNLVTLGIGAIIGAGIFVMTGSAASLYAGPSIMLSYVLAGIGCVFAGLCYAEFASMIPIAGSAYTYGYATLGEIVAWIIGWDLILEYAFGAATVASGWSSTLVAFLQDYGISLPPQICDVPGAQWVLVRGPVDAATTRSP